MLFRSVHRWGIDRITEIRSWGFWPKELPFLYGAEVLARTDEDTGEVDLDRDDFERIAIYKRQGHKKRIEKVFKRPMDEAFGKFFD